MHKIQDFISGGSSQIDILPGEYEGPLIIRHSCTVDGHAATLWAKNAAALVIESPNVTIKNLRVERTLKTADFTAIDVLSNNVRLENVEVFGDIRGLKISAPWELPRTINLGSFAANERNEFSVKLKVQETCRVICSVYGLSIEPQILSVGENDLKLTVDIMRDGMILYGDLILETPNKILRRIYITGRAEHDAPIQRLKKPVSSSQMKVATGSQTLPQVKSRPATQSPPKVKLPNVKKNRSILAPNSNDFCVTLAAKDLPIGISIDAYAFCLNQNNQVQCNEDMIFFDNPRHESFGVYLEPAGDLAGVGLSLQELPFEIQAVSIFFAVYDEGNRPENNFSKLNSGRILIREHENIFHEFPAGACSEKIFNALEIRRSKNQWQINFVGKGFKGTLNQLYDFYGVEIF